jgi:CHAT domain-containing protein/lipopolysaccharide biosynthesis regulator YciM
MTPLRGVVILQVLMLAAGPAIAGQDVLPESARAALDEVAAALRQGDYQKALPLAERAVRLAEQSGDRAALGRALAELGRSQWGRGQYAVARETLERGLTVFQTLNDTAGLSEVLMRLGETEFSMGRYTEALGRYELALERNREAPAPGREGRIRSNIGVALRFLGRFDEAAATTEAALKIFREMADEGGVGQAQTFLGIINRARSEYQKAIAAYAEAIAIRQKLGDRRGQAQVLGNLGNVYLDLSEYEKAIDAYTRSLAIAEEIGYAAQVGFSRFNLAAVLADLGRGSEALARFEQALATWRQIDRQPEVGRTLRQIALQRFHGHDQVDGARAALDEVLTIARRISDLELEAFGLLDLGVLDLAQGQHASAVARFEQGLEIARKMGSPNLEYQLLSQRGRARLQASRTEEGIADLRSSAAIVNDIRSRVTSDEAKIAFIDTRQAVFQDLAAALVDAGRPVEALEIAEAGRARAFADALQSRPTRSLPGDNLTVVDSPRIDEIRATARRLDATLVEYLIADQALLAWVVSPSGDVQMARTEGASRRLSDLARALLKALDEPAASTKNPAPARALLQELHRLAIGPVANWLPQSASKLVIVIPYGPLALVPFAALEDQQGTPLVARHTLSVAPSASIFRYTSAKVRSAIPGGMPMIFAAPEAPPNAGLPALEGSVEEGRRVATRLARFTPMRLEGKQATEHAAKRQLARATYIHFATHGLVSETRPTNSSVVLAEGDGEDGYLRAAEVYGLEIAADLVVLSGCSTGRGRITGDGVFGLPRAFLYAGASSVVASLWDISDRATVFLMDRFYAHLLRTGDKAAALRAAQLEARQRYPHPVLWAPFILVGEPR